MSENLELQVENLKSVSIRDLIFRDKQNRLCFVIPSYQRGYRWTEKEVKKLLDDLYEFNNGKGHENVGNFYCLQPIVVKRILQENLPARLGPDFVCDEHTDYYEVVDGQQRITTLYIFLKTLYLGDDITLFNLVYERDITSGFTRKKCLDSITAEKDYASIDLEEKTGSADEYYIKNAYVTLKKWMETKADSDILTVLTQNSMVIWYELPQDGSVDCYDVFRNINNGKIPLTDAELVKAMLLNRKYFSPDGGDAVLRNKVISQSQDLYARQWDEIQRTLSKPDVWSFITGNHDFKVDTRIDFLFKILVRKESKDAVGEELGLFYYYEEQLAQIEEQKDKTKDEKRDEKTKYIESVFKKLLSLYRTIQDWYEDPVTYNYIGHVMTYNIAKKAERRLTDRLDLIIELENDYLRLSHPEFIKSLKCRIKHKFKGCSLADLHYKEQGDIIEQLLMLFNIEELNAIHRRFNFILDNGDKWSVEHIKPQHEKFAKSDDRKDYLSNEKMRLEKMLELDLQQGEKDKLKAILKELEDILCLSEPPEDTFNEIAAKIDREVDGFEGDDIHHIGNLALLSLKRNSSFNNSPFYEKREKLQGWLTDPSMNIPYSTVRAFLKLYSKQEFLQDFTRWKKTDFDNYYNLLENTLKEFI